MKKILIVIGIVVLLIGAYALKIIYQAGQFKNLRPHFEGTVRQIEGIVGGEDIIIHHNREIAFISADDRYKRMHDLPGKGAIYSLNLKEPNARLVSLTEDLDWEIHPHGISMYESADSIIYLYVVDHQPEAHFIRVFTYNNGRLQLNKTFSNKALMISPNDVLAIDENRFYFTNDHGSKSNFGRKLEEYLLLKRSNVIYFDGTDYRQAAGKIAYANGINMRHDGKEVYVAGTTDRSVFVYDRDPKTGDLALKNQIFLNTGVDNIDLDEEGNLWVAGHPKMLSFVAHAKDINKPAPSQVIKIWKNGQGKYQHKEIYLDNGEELSASSIAAVRGNTMLVGPVLDDHILWCTLK